MADPLGKILLRGARRLFIWPLEAGLVLACLLYTSDAADD